MRGQMGKTSKLVRKVSQISQCENSDIRGNARACTDNFVGNLRESDGEHEEQEGKAGFRRETS